MPFCEVVNNLVCVTGYDIPSFPLLIRNQMCAFCEREIHMHLLGEFCAKLCFTILAPFLLILVCTWNTQVLDAFPQLTVRSEWKFLKQRDSNPLEMFIFFLLFSTVGWSRVGVFSLRRDLVSDFSCVLLLLLTHRKRQSGGVGWGLFVSLRSVLFFALGFQVF